MESLLPVAHGATNAAQNLLLFVGLLYVVQILFFQAEILVVVFYIQKLQLPKNPQNVLQWTRLYLLISLLKLKGSRWREEKVGGSGDIVQFVRNE